MEANTRRPSLRAAKSSEIRRDLVSFRGKAIELGASDAKVIPASYVVVQERVWMKCLVPRCGGAGLCVCCPPYTPQPDFMRKVVSQYQWAVVFRRDIEPIEDYVPASRERRREIAENMKTQEWVHSKTFEIVGRLESYAQSKSYDLAMGFSGGSCRTSLCASAPCAVLQNERCRHPLRARPSMEAVGIDVFGLAARVGWDVYMIRSIELDLSEIPCLVSIGILFVC